MTHFFHFRRLYCLDQCLFTRTNCQKVLKRGVVQPSTPSPHSPNGRVCRDRAEDLHTNNDLYHKIGVNKREFCEFLAANLQPKPIRKPIFVGTVYFGYFCGGFRFCLQTGNRCAALPTNCKCTFSQLRRSLIPIMVEYWI